MQQVIDDDKQPAGYPGWSIGMIPGCFAFGPGTAARPWPILQPGDVAGKVPPIDNKMCATDDGQR